MKDPDYEPDPQEMAEHELIVAIDGALQFLDRDQIMALVDEVIANEKRESERKVNPNEPF